MKNLEKKVYKVNRLLHLNYEVEKVYQEAYENIINNDLKVFFRNTAFFRNKCSEALISEIDKLDGNPVPFDRLSFMFNDFLMKFKTLIHEENEPELLNEVCEIKKLSINAYNDLLQERNLPLSLCRVLLGQVDEIQKTLNTIKVEERLVA